jgi:hypothetical protein
MDAPTRAPRRNRTCGGICERPRLLTGPFFTHVQCLSHKMSPPPHRLDRCCRPFPHHRSEATVALVWLSTAWTNLFRRRGVPTAA